MENNSLNVGLEFVRKAIQFDSEKNYNSAIQHYNLSLNYFDLVLKGKNCILFLNNKSKSSKKIQIKGTNGILYNKRLLSIKIEEMNWH